LYILFLLCDCSLILIQNLDRSNQVCVLWLNDEQISKHSGTFPETLISKSNSQVVTFSVDCQWAAGDGLRKLKMENEVTIPDPTASLSGGRELRVLTVELAQALAVLEDEPWRTDPVGERVRWSAR